MELFSAFSFILGGLCVLAYAANMLVDWSVNVARKFWISEMVIGLTIVAIGTSAPELIVSLLSTWGGHYDIALGNVIGSNIANILLILGLTAIIIPMTLARSTLLIDLPLAILTTLLLILLSSDMFFDGATSNVISRIDGILLLLFAIVFFIYNIRGKVIETPDIDEPMHIVSTRRAIFYIAWGIFWLFFGGKILVEWAVAIAKIYGLSESIIALTIVAVGTSVPELATSLVAALKKRTSITIGNIIGSNILNILIIIGFSSIIHPLILESSMQIDLLVALFAPILLLSLSQLWIRHRIGRTEWMILVFTYVWYIAYLILREIK